MGESVVPCKRCKKSSGVRAGVVRVDGQLVEYVACRVCYSSFEKAEAMTKYLYRKGASDASQ